MTEPEPFGTEGEGHGERMAVDQELFHNRQLPAMGMEQMVEYNSKLGRIPILVSGREFGAELVNALPEAVTGNDMCTRHAEGYFDHLVP